MLSANSTVCGGKPIISAKRLSGQVLLSVYVCHDPAAAQHTSAQVGFHGNTIFNNAV